jgi:hypothetical protein
MNKQTNTQRAKDTKMKTFTVGISLITVVDGENQYQIFTSKSQVDALLAEGFTQCYQKAI